ncbi:MAG: HAD family hydrolase [Dongiaceae bacterium]
MMTEQISPVSPRVSSAPTRRVEPFALIPQSGRILQGRAEIDESAVTGSVLPALRQAGDQVLAGSRNGAALLEIAVDPEPPFPSEAQRAAGSKTGLFGPFLRFWIRKLLACAVAGILAGLVWMVWRGQSVTLQNVFYLVIGLLSPGLLLVWPSQRVAAEGWLRRHGMVCRDFDQLERLRRIGRIVFGRAGTVSRGQLRVVSLQPAPGVKPAEFVTLAASAHQLVEDVWGRAILAFGISHRVRLRPAEDVVVEPGEGLSASVDGQTVLVGRSSWLERHGIDVSPLESVLQEYLRLGRQVLFAGADAPAPRCLGILALADPPKPGAVELVKTCKQSGIETLLIGGVDSVATATLAGLLGVSRVIDEATGGQLERHSTVAVGRSNDRAMLAQYEKSVAIGDAAVTQIPAAVFGSRREDPRHVLDFIMLAQTLARRLPLGLLLVWVTGWPIAAAGLGLIPLPLEWAGLCLSVGIVIALFQAQLLRLVGTLANDDDES